MAPGYPININGVRIRTSEALYQACRFPHLPELQREIIAQRSPMTAKMKSRRYMSDSRQDFDSIKIRIMRWTIRVKLSQNWGTFAQLLLSTGQLPIVEESRRDRFWGAKRNEEYLEGVNGLGRLLMELRDKIYLLEGRHIGQIDPPNVDQLLLFDQRITSIAPSRDETHAVGRSLMFDQDSYGNAR